METRAYLAAILSSHVSLMLPSPPYYYLLPLSTPSLPSFLVCEQEGGRVL